MVIYHKLVNGYFLNIEVRRRVVIDENNETYTLFKGKINISGNEGTIIDSEIEFDKNTTAKESIKSNLIDILQNNKLSILKIYFSCFTENDFDHLDVIDSFYNDTFKASELFRTKDDINDEIGQELHNLVTNLMNF